MTYSRGSAIKLTPYGQNIDIDTIDIQRDILEKVEPYWERKRAENKRRKLTKESDNSNAAKVYLEPEDEYTEEILSHLREMDPGKFENFCRGSLY